MPVNALRLEESTAAQSTSEGFSIQDSHITLFRVFLNKGKSR